MMRPRLRGAIKLGGDKSLSHRAVMFASMAQGRSRIRNLSAGADVAGTCEVYRSLGVSIENHASEVVISSKGFQSLNTMSESLYCGNSGTTLRLTMGILAGSKISCQLSGDESLNCRPVKRVIAPLNMMGGDLSTANRKDTPPVIIKGRPLHGIKYNSNIASAQVKSAVLLAGLQAEGATEYTEPSRSRDHTERFLQSQGFDLQVNGTCILLNPAGSIRPFEYDVPCDISTAAFFIVGALLMHESEITINDVLLNETRTGALDILIKMGAAIRIDNKRMIHGEPIGDLIVRSSSLQGFDTGEFDTPTFIDEIPILAFAAMFAEGTTVFNNIGELRVKESDRALGIVQMIRAYGGNAELQGDKLIVCGGRSGKADLANHKGDHRIAMCIEIANLISEGAVSGEYHDVISVSAPEFYENLNSVLR